MGGTGAIGRKTWFTADTHFGHANILKHCNRPWPHIVAHDEALIARWNEVVAPEDVVYVVGDFAYHNTRAVAGTFWRLNGEKHLITGNHDGKEVLELPWASISERLILTVDGVDLALDHYPGRSWYGQSHGRVQLYGHVHGAIDDLWNACDVGVDRWDYHPVSVDQALERIKRLPRPSWAKNIKLRKGAPT